jgi:aryl-alcohol dehydrogenase-like predicted oxidoreductase
MIYRTLGRTGLRVSLLGQGTGGDDPLGQKSGRSEKEMIALLHRAFEWGINLFDTSPAYINSEMILGKALKELPRDQVIVSTKIALAGGPADQPLHVTPPEEIAPAIEKSLRQLQVDTIDVMLMAVADPIYFDTVVNDQIPILQRLQQQGKIRFLGSSEQTRSDGDHRWLQRILPTDLLDVVMVGHNMINQSARRTVFPICKENNVGVLNIFTVRNLFWNPLRLKEVIADLIARKIVSDDIMSGGEPLAWLIDDDVQSLVEAAYRYAAYTEPVSAVICGTIEHNELKDNVHTITKGPLSKWKLKRLEEIFGQVAEAIGD